MSKKLIITLGFVGGCVVLSLIALITSIGDFNSYTQLENKAKAIQVDNTNVLDNTRKSIRDAAKVSDQEVEALTNIIVGATEARGSSPSGGGVGFNMAMVTEAVPSITSIETKKTLLNIIVAGRKDWQASQTRLTDVKRQADDMLGVFPSNVTLKLFGKEEIKIVIVTSSETKENFKTGEDNKSWIE